MDWLMTTLANGFSEGRDLALLFARLIVGLMFAISGGYKLFTRDQRKTMRETLEDADIPKPGVMTYFVSANELVFGALLAVGLFTVPAAVVLAAISIVAFVTQGYEPRKDEGYLFWFSTLLMKHQILLLSSLLMLIAFGGGALALDAEHSLG